MTEDASGLVSTGAVASKFGVPVSTIKFWAKRGVLPGSITVQGSGRRAWRISDLPEIEERINARRARRERQPLDAA